MSNNFFKVAKLGLRFPSVKGDLTAEQLFQLPLTSKNNFDLDSVAKGLSHQLKAQSEESFVSTSHNPVKDRLALALEVVKEVIADKIAENNAKTKAASDRHEREKLLEVLQGKKDAALANLSEAELEERIRALS